MTDGNTKTFESSALEWATYDEANQTLSIKFKGSGAYDYEGVPLEIWGGLCNCESAGSYVHRNIRGKFGLAGKEDEQTSDQAESKRPVLRPASEARKP